MGEGGSHCLELVGLVGLFDSLGDDVEVEALAEIDDALNEVGFLVFGVEAIDEHLVDLKDVDR